MYCSFMPAKNTALYLILSIINLKRFLLKDNFFALAFVLTNKVHHSSMFITTSQKRVKQGTLYRGTRDRPFPFRDGRICPKHHHLFINNVLCLSISLIQCINGANTLTLLLKSIINCPFHHKNTFVNVFLV